VLELRYVGVLENKILIYFVEESDWKFLLPNYLIILFQGGVIRTNNLQCDGDKL
jgi:hypothetical protein